MERILQGIHEFKGIGNNLNVTDHDIQTDPHYGLIKEKQTIKIRQYDIHHKVTLNTSQYKIEN
jgi:hypothetical protein